MSMRVKCWLICLVMIVAGAVFVLAAMSAPTLGQVIYIGDFEFGPELWRVCYMAYAAVIAVVFVGSFFVKDTWVK